ncbi:MAG: hypothetical protein RR584_16155 [Comamonas sp.]
MRPAGTISQALLKAVQQLATAERGPTLREIAAAAELDVDVARQAIPNMKRYGRIRICGERRVQGRNRPVAEYGMPLARAEAANDFSLSMAIAAWG